jgi:predicted RNA polymerase sigma factor
MSKTAGWLRLSHERSIPAPRSKEQTEQNRSLWDREQIAEGLALLAETLSKGSRGPYQVQAAIAACHDEAERADATDWPQILALYELLAQLSENPMVKLNHAVAAGMVHGPTKGLELVAAVKTDKRLADHHRLHAVEAHLREMIGENETAVSLYRTAAAKAANECERNYLLLQASRLAKQRENEPDVRCPESGVERMGRPISPGPAEA